MKEPTLETPVIIEDFEDEAKKRRLVVQVRKGESVMVKMDKRNPTKAEKDAAAAEILQRIKDRDAIEAEIERLEAEAEALRQQLNG